jgi:hypothetical protein
MGLAWSIIHSHKSGYIVRQGSYYIWLNFANPAWVSEAGDSRLITLTVQLLHPPCQNAPLPYDPCGAIYYTGLR